MEKLKLIHCGVGGMGRAWTRGATSSTPDFEIVAIVDIADASLAETGEALKLSSDRHFKSLEAALDKVKADAILTVTPPVIHAQHAKIAFEHGLHVLTEKPIADTLDNAKKMVQWAKDAGKQLMVAQNYRFGPPTQKLKSIVHEKPLGEVGHGHLDFYIAADFTGSFREKMEFPLLVDMAIHHIDLIRSITGKNIQRVTAQGFRPSWSWYAHEPGLKMLLELDGGMPFSYSGDWSAIGRQTTWNGHWRLQCADGSIHMENDAIQMVRSERWNKNPTTQDVTIEPLMLTGQARLLSDFAKAIRTNTPAETSGADNLWSFAAVMAGVKSAQENRAVDVAELIERP